MTFYKYIYIQSIYLSIYQTSYPHSFPIIPTNNKKNTNLPCPATTTSFPFSSATIIFLFPSATIIPQQIPQ